MSGHFPLSVESRLEAFFDEREARSRRGSVPRNKKQRIKAINENTRVLETGPFFDGSIIQQIFKNVVLKGLKPCEQSVTRQLEQTQ